MRSGTGFDPAWGGSEGEMQLRFFAARASADELAAAGTAAAVFFGDGLGKVDAGDVGNGGEPGEHIGEFAEAFFMCAGSQRCRQLADLFDEPEERGFDTASLVLVEIHFADQGLEVAEGDAGLWWRRIWRRSSCHGGVSSGAEQDTDQDYDYGLDSASD